MEVRNCRNCGRLFNYIGGVYKNLCPACIDELELKFLEVKEYVEENRGCTINEISEKMEVSVRQIEKWIREERLCFTDDSPIGIECERCGKMIKTGRFCELCKNDMSNQMNDLYKAVNKPSHSKAVRSGNSKMHYLDKD